MNKPLNIFYIIGYFQPERGYEEYYSAINLAKKGHDVTVITSDRIAPFRGLSITDRKREIGFTHLNGVNIIRLPSFELYTDFIIMFGLLKTLIKKRPDIVHCHTTMQFPSLVTPILCKIFKIKCLIDCHEFNYLGFPLNPIKPGLKSWIVKLEYKLFRSVLAKLALNFSDRIVSVAPVCTNFLIDYFNIVPGKIKELNLCVDIDLYKKNSYSRSIIRNRLGISDDKVLFLFSGLLSERKKASTYIDIFANLSPNYCLILVVSGTNCETEGLKKKIHELALGNRIFVQTDIDSKEIVDYYSAADVGIWLFNNSVSYLESMSCSLPVCISDMQLSYLTNSSCSFILNSNNSVNEFILDLKKLNLENLNLHNLGIQSRMLVEDKYSYVSYANELLNIYYQLL
jgi:glycosyltransferase involved in cell wall biosynthesis